MNSDFYHQSSEEINPVQHFNTSCSCSKCNSIACFMKRESCQLNTCDIEAPRDNSFMISISLNYIDILNKKVTEKESFTEEYSESIIGESETHKTPSIQQSQISFDMNSMDQHDDVIQNNKLVDEFQHGTNTNFYNLQVSSNTAKLRAQIMNFPYRDFEDSIPTLHKPEAEPITLPKMTIFEVLEKIKEVYNACSCKVCECIGVKCQENEFCKCKPCDCDECKSSQKRVTISSGRGIPHSTCLCPRCKGDLCKAIAKYGSTPKCNCTQCECVHCTDSTPEPCSCEPCQCIECKRHKLHSYKELIVAAVGDDYQARSCQCSPCRCVECTHSVANDFSRREMSTGLNSHQQACLNEACLLHENDSCRCERRDELMRKPVQSNNTNIRRAIITQSMSKVNKNSRDVIAMFAAVSNRYSNCSCDQCKCIKCNYDVNSAKTAKLPSVKSRLPMKTINNTMCDCDVCNCLNCEKVIKPSKDHLRPKAFYGHKSCPSGCTDDKMKNTLTADNIPYCVNYQCKRCVGKSNFFEFINPIEKENNQIPELFENNMHHSINKLCNGKVENHHELLTIRSSHISSECKTNNNYLINSANNIKQICKTVNKKTREIKHAKLIDSSNIANEANIFKKTIHFQEPRSKNSANSSLYFTKNIGSVLAKSENKNKSRESSSNSSGNDFTNHLVQFPKRYVESCIDDATKLIKETDLKLKAISVAPKDYPVKKQSSILSNFIDNEYAKSIFYNEHDPSRSTQSCKRKTYILNDKEISFVDKHTLPKQAGVAIQCRPLKGEISNVTRITQTENQNRRGPTIIYNEIDYLTHFNECCNKEDAQKNVCEKETNFIATNNETLDKDYERIQKTSQDFSQQLLQMLAEYETANREFKSISQKLKYPPIDRVDKKSLHCNKEILDTNNVQKNLSKTDYNEVPSKNLNKSLVYTYGVQENVGNKNDFNVEPKQFSSKTNYKTYKIMSDENVCDIIETSNNEPIIIDVKDDSSKYILSSYFTEHSEISLVDDSILNFIVEGNEPSSDLIDSQIKRKIKRKVSKKYKRSSSISNRTKRFVSNDLVFHVAENDNKFYNLLTLNSKQSEIKSSVVEESVPPADDSLTSFINHTTAKIRIGVPNTALKKQNVPDVFHMNTPHREAVHIKCAEETKPILKNNYCVKSKPTSVSKIYKQTSEVGTKDEIKTISWDHKVEQKNKALDNCESMKVRSLSVRGVSNHTVVVKWNAPVDLKNIRGYEMLVDGRLVQKVFNASSSMAVVTCLPDSKSMLLTVRTVTRLPCASGHSPSTTIVYKPRDKKKQD